MRDFIIHLLGGYTRAETLAISKRDYDQGYNAGVRSAQFDEGEMWKAGYRYAKDEWAESRAVEDAELAELSMLVVAEMAVTAE